MCDSLPDLARESGGNSRWVPLDKDDNVMRFTENSLTIAVGGNRQL